ncbi:Uncharacterised protein [Citrobacter youngae]|nr:Uncharacterised protein [Citrobacter youngae]
MLLVSLHPIQLLAVLVGWEALQVVEVATEAGAATVRIPMAVALTVVKVEIARLVRLEVRSVGT